MEDDIKIKSQDIHNYSCPGCGSNMVFDPETSSLNCPYCGSKEAIASENLDIKEYDYEAAEQSLPIDWGNQKKIITCKNCGSEVILDAVETANSCAFCGSSYIVKNDELVGIVPESIIPFKVSQKQSLDMFSKWIKKRHFAPRALKTNFKCEKINGVYIPNWTYDASTYSTYSAEVGTHYYVTEHYTENGVRKTRQVRKTRWSYTNGSYSNSFDDVLINASKQIDDGLMSKLQPFHLEELVPYNAKFLSGFIAERYSIGLKEGFNRAKNFIDHAIDRSVRIQINGDEIRNLCIDTDFSNIKYKHILLPLWISAYAYKNKIYRYMVNGQTGEVQGYAPISAFKIAALIVLGVSLCMLGYFFYQNY